MATQHELVKNLYESVCLVWGTSFKSKANPRAPKWLDLFYEENGIYSGKVLDVGCGTGSLKNKFSPGFDFTGVDLSHKMAEMAQKRGYSNVIVGPIEEAVKYILGKSFDHVVVLSSMCFVNPEDFSFLLKEFERIARVSIFLELEQYKPDQTPTFKRRGISVFNHDSSKIKNPTEIKKDLPLWWCQSKKEIIYGDIVFKMLN